MDSEDRWHRVWIGCCSAALVLGMVGCAANQAQVVDSGSGAVSTTEVRTVSTVATKDGGYDFVRRDAGTKTEYHGGQDQVEASGLDKSSFGSDLDAAILKAEKDSPANFFGQKDQERPTAELAYFTSSRLHDQTKEGGLGPLQYQRRLVVVLTFPNIDWSGVSSGPYRAEGDKPQKSQGSYKQDGVVLLDPNTGDFLYAFTAVRGA